MTFFRKLKDFILGEDLVTDGEGRHDQRASASQTDSQPQSSPSQSAPRHEAKAATQAQATAARQPAPPPLLQDGHPVTGGGIQGLQWYTSSMRQDADGDLADQFLSEPSSGHGAKRSHSGRERELPSLQVHQPEVAPCSSCGNHTQHGQLQQAAAADVIVDRGNVYVVPVQ